MSMLAFALPLAWAHHFEVDGSVDADDRAQLLHIYGGNALDSPASRVFCDPLILNKAVTTFVSDRDTTHSANLIIDTQESEKC